MRNWLRQAPLAILIIILLGTVSPASGIEVVRAAPAAQYMDAGWLIDHPCESWLLEDPGSTQPRVICSGVFSGDWAGINVPVPYVNARLPELGLVDLPLIVQLGWTPGTFDYTDSAPRAIRWSGNRLEGYRVELSLTPFPGTPTLAASSARQGNLAGRSLDDRLLLVARNRYPAICAESSLDDIPANLGGLELCPRSSVDAQLPGGLVTSPIGSMLGRYRWDDADPFRGGWFAGWSEWASVDGSGNSDGSPAFRVVFTTGWALFARVQWDYHFRELTETQKHCGWEYYGEPGWYWDWDEWPPICVDVTTTYWRKYCPVNNPEPGCPTISYGHSSDWWQYIGSLEAHTIRLADAGYSLHLDLVVLQAQPLLTGP